VTLDEAGVKAAGFGQRVPMPNAPPGPCAWLDSAGHLVAVGERDDAGLGKVLRGFPR